MSGQKVLNPSIVAQFDKARDQTAEKIQEYFLGFLEKYAPRVCAGGASLAAAPG